ncbi:hypothetical protein Q9299_09575 [Gemmobacter fulvus]|uniref:hypothetical protein n=1 Tax=Gemmobacter fulvus TaxID=2840474 RepID=UPI0027968A1B|nr:hypothetical protein [Gemmobacter fulvus]MDQ1848534.1 hypothetical protein [Gemmobacter fulvus]
MPNAHVLATDTGLPATILPDTPEGRATFIAATLGLLAPLPVRDGDGCPSPEVCAFCLLTGASLDFIFRGDIRPMLRYAYAAAQRVDKQGAAS